MTDAGRSRTSDDEPSWEDLLANPHLQFDLDSEVLPVLLGLVAGCLTCRPGIFCPHHTPSGTVSAAARSQS